MSKSFLNPRMSIFSIISRTVLIISVIILYVSEIICQSSSGPPTPGPPKQVAIKGKSCPTPLSYRSNQWISQGGAGQGFTKLIVGFDSENRPLSSCRVKIDGVYRIGRGFQSNFDAMVNDTWVSFGNMCFVRAPNDTEIVFNPTGQYNEEIQFYYTSNANVVVWVSINKLPGWPNVTPLPALTKEGSRSTSPKMYVARCKIAFDDGITVALPAVVYQNDLEVAYSTYDQAVYTCTDFEVPICF